LAHPAAALSPLPTSGACGFVFSIDYPFDYLYGQNPGSGYGVSALGTIDFTNQVISLNLLLQNPGNSTNTSENQSAFTNLRFVTSSGPVAGSYIISFNLDGSAPSSNPADNAFNWNAIPVNDGNSVLIQSFNTQAGSQGSSPVAECQMQYFDSVGENTHLGSLALGLNTSTGNTAVGFGAIAGSNSGVNNTAVGFDALSTNTSGINNTAFGATALYSNTTGKGNAAQGANALYTNTTGIRNLGIGNNALFNNNGSYNIGLGFDAGYNVTAGSNNIEIGSQGSASDNGTIQIGVQGTQTSTTIAGIFGTAVSGSAVYVSSTGQLGVQASSERFKTDIVAMPDVSTGLEQLRPVTFHYKSDPQNVVQYGLIAEEVAKVYPELVIRDASGNVMGVHYEELAPMLLGAMQRERREMAGKIAEYDAQTKKQREMLAALSQQNAQQAAQIRELKKESAEYATRAEVRELQSQLKAALAKLQAEDALLTRR
jgi:hypothetical protein